MSEKFEAWGLVELMGHQRVAGRLTDQPLGGGNMLRVDIPDGDGFRTVFYGNSAIYAVHITDEAAARALAGKAGTQPTYAWELQRDDKVRRLASAAPDDESDDDEYEDREPLDIEGETGGCP